ncbi:MAG: L-sorbose 1-phosphate reductase [Bacteroidetes bacterium GWF2_42_66]|nr:MAG: L-sorbose 1-phosphate reductase [Bacteroidetes bacterium GWA2_42_15]OFX96120.1 MAG: L-sorbose 1-phosphate reductase [Bacteroidetes bacterium GWE2_42_39]OFY45178.1 MAG: L-sorbose 1-phosphate reductase [Bacteroidetes bacterium GWF2_42_66]HBL73589.1 L-sorbose 1-phosphate reductase [Prolixibacteraceae bacterium]HCR90021.1 L-sorbose 1-phosphate reductase [Prolixibacteraceae bacterium]
MKTKAVRIYGKKDLRLEEFELPQITEDEILAKVVSDSICMSSYKAAEQASDHKRVPNDIAENPVIIGHEFAGELIQVGANWQHKFKAGQKFSIQPAIYYEGGPVGVLSAPGYSYRFIGGDATYVIIPKDVLIQDCLLAYDGPGFYPASLAEPLSCVIGAMHANYHTTPGSYIHQMEIVQGGKMAILAGVGPMGLAAINYVIRREDRKPSLMVVTDIDQSRLDRAASIYSPEWAKENGIELIYVNTGNVEDPVAKLKEISGGTGYNDVFVFAPVAPVIEQGDAILAFDGCLNFFAGPSNPQLSAKMNFYNVHYAYTHLVGTSGGNNDDMVESLEMFGKGLDPAGLVTHIGGLNAVIETTLHLPQIPGGKKLIYTHVDMPLTAISEFKEKGKTDPFFAKLDEIVAKTNGLWSVAAEDYLLANAKNI